MEPVSEPRGFESHTMGRFTSWHLSSWLARGILHGFLGSSLDVLDASQNAVFCETHFIAPTKLALLKQVHGAALVENPDPHDTPAIEPEADGSYLRIAGYEDEVPPGGIVLGIKTADCAPVLVCSADGRFRAALHCGWRSAVLGIFPTLLARAQELGVRPAELSVAIGPCARVCCYEVGREFYQKELSGWHSLSDLEASIKEVNNRIFFDLPEFLLQQASLCGLPVEHVDVLRFCTICDQRFFSYRRQKADAGRQLSYIAGPNVKSKVAYF